MREKYIKVGAVVTMLLVFIASYIFIGGDPASADVKTTLTKDAVTYNKSTQNLTITNGLENVNEVYCGVATIKKVKVSGNVVRTANVSAWSIYDYNAAAPGVAVTIDLSSISCNNDSYVILKALQKDGKYSDAFALKFEKNVSKLAPSITYAAGGPVLKVTDKSTKAELATSTLEYRLTSTNWAPLATLDLNGLTYKGASLILRSAPTSNDLTKVGASNLSTDLFYEYPTDTTYMPVYVAGKLAGKEGSVKVKAAGSVPSATFNYTTGKVTMPLNTECRFVTGTTTTPGTIGAWTDAYAGKETVIKGAGGSIPTSGYIEVRKKPTAKGPSSRSRVLPYTVCDAPLVYASSGEAMSSGVTAQGAVVTARQTADKTTGVKITYAADGKVFKVSFENGGTDLYEFRAVSPGGSVDSAKNIKVAKSTVAGSVKSGSALYVRVAADKTNGNIASDFAFAGIVS